MKTGFIRLPLALVLFGIVAAAPASADSIAIGGIISQSTADGTGPAGNNLQLNAIQDGDAYTIALTFTGSVIGAGTFSLTGLSVLFSDATAAATESAFSTASITVTPMGGTDQISLLACVTTGSGCLFGNFAALNFMIASAGLNSSSAAEFIPGLTPLDLLEDDGTTDIQGTVTSYSYTPDVVTAPEPGTLLLLVGGLLVIACKGNRVW